MYGAEIVYSEGSKGSNGAVELALDMAAARRLVLHALPVRQPGQPARPLQRHRARDPRGARRGRGVRRRARHRRHADGQRPPAQGGARRRRQDRRRRADAGRAGAGPALARRRLHPADHRPRRCSTARSSSPTSDAIVWTRKLLDEERLFAGVSSGAIARVAVRIAGELDEGNVVFIVADDGWKYLSSGIYTRPVDEIENLDSTVWW